MHILDDTSDKKLSRITLFLTESEALQLESYLNQFLQKPKDKGLHFHLSSEDYQKEITVCIYDSKNFSELNHKTQQLIQGSQ